MRICDNGIMRDATAEEIEKFRKAELELERENRTRPLTADEVSRMIMSQQVNSLVVNDNTALRMLEFYPSWGSEVSYTVGFKVTHNGKLWRVMQAHTSQVGWEPENAPSLWEQICRTYSGEESDPIPYSGNMRLENGKYYIQNDVVYLCNRDTVNPVYHALADLVGQYVQIKEELSK